MSDDVFHAPETIRYCSESEFIRKTPREQVLWFKEAKACVIRLEIQRERAGNELVTRCERLEDALDFERSWRREVMEGAARMFLRFGQVVCAICAVAGLVTAAIVPLRLFGIV